MLKKRIIPKFLIQNGRLVKAQQFHNNFREAGNPVSTARVYNDYGVDEIIFLDIEASPSGRQTVVEVIKKASEAIFMPFTVGGGIRSIADINELLRAGADKVAINTAALDNPVFIEQAAYKYGSQCLTIAIDYREVEKGKFRVFSNGGYRITDWDPLEWSRRMEAAGCGEIILCSIDRDGMMSGYDLDMLEKASAMLRIPVIASSGAGSLEDCCRAFESGAAAIAISSMFLFTDHSPIKVRSYLASQHISVRASRNSRN
ncbi:MAG: imidazole glycerol phosphate synthase cyclase subunit [Syntrophomonadaceae bacterium]|nr:imidazole glycerol phosphate synthase cyclase subunit [Syntrophomonadaceae bacterium]